jgi:hypothetical protein
MVPPLQQEHDMNANERNIDDRNEERPSAELSEQELDQVAGGAAKDDIALMAHLMR